MLNNKFFLAVFVFFFTIHSAQSIQQNSYYVKLKAENKVDRSKIASIIHIDQVIENNVYSVVNQLELSQLKYLMPNSIVEYHQYKKALTNEKSNEIEFPAEDEKYHTYKEMVTKLNNLNQKLPDVTELLDLGNSIDGRKLLGIRLFAKKKHQKNEFVPGIVFTGAHHAREHLSVEVPLMLAEYLVNNYNKEAKVKQLVDSRDIYILPMVNPDGAMYDIIGKRYKLWRKNRRDNNDGNYGVDLNRNYSYGWGTGGSSSSTGSNIYMGPSPFSEPETISIKNLIESKPNIRIFLSYHTYSELILYPWGGKYEGIGGEDEQIHKKMAYKMASWNGYRPQQSSDLYIASGDTCDWAYGEHGIFCFTFELSPRFGFGGSGFYPGAGVIDKVFNDNLQPALYLIEKAGNPRQVLD